MKSVCLILCQISMILVKWFILTTRIDRLEQIGSFEEPFLDNFQLPEGKATFRISCVAQRL